MLNIFSTLAVALLGSQLVSAAPSHSVPEKPVCVDTTKANYTVKDYTFFSPDQNVAYIYLKKGIMYNNVGEKVAINGSHWEWEPKQKDLKKLHTGKFEYCTFKEEKYFTYTPLPTKEVAKPKTETKFFICHVDTLFGVYLTTGKVKGLSCTKNKVFVQEASKKVVEKAAHKSDVKKPYQFLLAKKGNHGLPVYHGKWYKRSVLDSGIAQSFSTDLAAPSTDSSMKPHRLTMGTMFRDKSQYLLEWIEFYLMVGVDHFIMYDHASTDSPLNVLQPYVDAGLVTYVSWPPADISAVAPAPAAMAEKDVAAQEAFLNKAYPACVKQEWTTHRQGACQFAASVDMLRRSYEKSTWLGFFDIDEFVYPTTEATSTNLADVFEYEAPFSAADYIVIAGSNFGTNGFKTAPQPAAGESIPALVTQNYVLRRSISEDGNSPYASGTEAFLDSSIVEGELAQSFSLPETYARKAFVKPEKAIYSLVHDWVQTPSIEADWNSVEIWLNYPKIKMNHYAYLSVEDANAKAIANGNPMAAYNEEQDKFYSAEADEEIQHLVAPLRERMLKAAFA